MIFGIGTDIIEVERIGQLVARGREYLQTIFTDQEIQYCESKSRRAQHYAARYAAKEAVLKALGTGWRDGLGFCDIEIADDEQGQPVVAVHGQVKKLFDCQQIRRASISMSHDRECAIAVIILET